VDAVDWSALANSWLSIEGAANWNADCDIAGGTSEGVIDGEDAAVFADNWLEGIM
jgi:hypothetical protein